MKNKLVPVNYLLYLLLGIIAILLSVCVVLFVRGKEYEQQNHALIIQNDSIISVNISLSNSLSEKQASLKVQQ